MNGIIPFGTKLGMFNQFFDGLFIPQIVAGSDNWIPSMDIIDKGDKYLLSVDVPDVDPIDLNVEISDGVLTVSGKRQTRGNTQTENYRLIERKVGSFKRSVKIGESIDVDNIKATHSNGVLTLEIPKKLLGNEKKKILISIG